MASDQGLPSHSSSKETELSLSLSLSLSPPPSPDDRSKLREEFMKVQKQSSLSLSLSLSPSPDDASKVTEEAMSVQDQSSLSPDGASKVSDGTMSVQEQCQETKSDDNRETKVTSFKLFGVIIEKSNPEKTETSTKVIFRGSSTTSTSKKGKEIETSTRVINDEHLYTKKRKLSSVKEQNAECGQQQQHPCHVPPQEGPWTIRKTLTKSDIDQSSRLLIGKKLMDLHVLPFLTEAQKAMAKTIEGAPLYVWDDDEKSLHQLVLKQWKTGSYVLTSNWKREFVQRRKLEVNDTIGLLWDNINTCFYFGVIQRSQLGEASSSTTTHGCGEEN